MSKYGSVKTEVDGIRFDSKREAARYGELKLLLKAGEITDLELQPVYPMIVNQHKVCSYRADFRYMEKGKQITEDVKGCRTAIYRLKKKLLKACYGIEVCET